MATNMNMPTAHSAIEALIDHYEKVSFFILSVKDALRFIVSSPILYWNLCIK
jgi:hypothetical protein